MIGAYDRTLQIALRHRRSTMAVAAFLLVGTVYLFMIIPKGFLPSEDIEQINGTPRRSKEFPTTRWWSIRSRSVDILLKDPNVAYVDVDGRARPYGSMNQGMLTIRLKPRARPQVEQVIQEMRPKLATIPGINVYPAVIRPPIRIGGMTTKALYQFTLQETDTEDLFNASQDFTARMRKLPGLLDVTSDLQIRNPQVNVMILRDRLRRWG